MIFVVMCRDRAGALDLRKAHIEAHRAFLRDHAHPVATLVSGPLIADAGGTMIGSFFMVEAATRGVIEAWQADDPLHRIGLWETVMIEAFDKRVDNLGGQRT